MYLLRPLELFAVILIYTLPLFIIRFVGLCLMLKARSASQFGQAAFFAILMTIISIVMILISEQFKLPVYVYILLDFIFESIIPVKFFDRIPVAKKLLWIFAIVIATYALYRPMTDLLWRLI